MLINIKAEITYVSKDSFIIEQWHDMTDPGCAMSLKSTDRTILSMAKRLINQTAFIKADFNPFSKEIRVIKVEE